MIVILWPKPVEVCASLGREELKQKGMGYSSGLNHIPMEADWKGRKMDNHRDTISGRVWRTWRCGERGREKRRPIRTLGLRDSGIICRSAN
jgi:hypothetical protein